MNDQSNLKNFLFVNKKNKFTKNLIIQILQGFEFASTTDYLMKILIEIEYSIVLMWNIHFKILSQWCALTINHDLLSRCNQLLLARNVCPCLKCVRLTILNLTSVTIYRWFGAYLVSHFAETQSTHGEMWTDWWEKTNSKMRVRLQSLCRWFVEKIETSECMNFSTENTNVVWIKVVLSSVTTII